MQELHKRLSQLEQDFIKAYDRLDIDAKLAKVESLEKEIAEPEIWRDVKLATEKNQAAARLTTETGPWILMKTQISDLKELLDITGLDLRDELAGQIEAMEHELTRLKGALRFTGPYDQNEAIIRITSGAGGTEAMDWAGMLERMYLRFFEKQGFAPAMLERTISEEAGIKTAVYEVAGGNVYGTLKSEHGVHRLVRLSPFNANNLRQRPLRSSKFSPLSTSPTKSPSTKKTSASTSTTLAATVDSR